MAELSDPRRQRAIEKAAAVVPNGWESVTFAEAVLMTIQIIEIFEREMEKQRGVCPTCRATERHPRPNFCSDAWHIIEDESPTGLRQEVLDEIKASSERTKAARRAAKVAPRRLYD